MKKRTKKEDPRQFLQRLIARLVMDPDVTNEEYRRASSIVNSVYNKLVTTEW